jgi:hypothetical protein
MKIAAVRLFGGAFNVYALAKGDHGENCPTREFLSELQESNSPDFGRLMRYLKWSSAKLLMNEDQFKALGDGLFEFRGRGGARLFCFLDAGALILCTNGYVKKKQKIDPAELVRAKNWRIDYWRAKAEKKLEFLDETNI